MLQLCMNQQFGNINNVTKCHIIDNENVTFCYIFITFGNICPRKKIHYSYFLYEKLKNITIVKVSQNFDLKFV